MFVKSYELNHTSKYMLSDGTKLGKFMGVSYCAEGCEHCSNGDDDICVNKTYTFYNELTFSKYINGSIIFLGLLLDTSS